MIARFPPRTPDEAVPKELVELLTEAARLVAIPVSPMLPGRATPSERRDAARRLQHLAESFSVIVRSLYCWLGVSLWLLLVTIFFEFSGVKFRKRSKFLPRYCQESLLPGRHEMMALQFRNRSPQRARVKQLWNQLPVQHAETALERRTISSARRISRSRNN